MKSPSSVVVTNRKLRVLALGLVHSWGAKLTASIGASPGVGSAKFGDVRLKNGEYRQETLSEDEDKFLDTTTGEAPRFTHDGRSVPDLGAEVQSAADGELGRVQLVTLGKAKDLLGDIARKALNTFEYNVNRIRPGQNRTYRAFLMVMQSRKLMSLELGAALNELASVVVKRPKRVGVQRISTRREDLPIYGGFQFSGKFAFRQFQGRPLLPEGVWLSRYRARVKKRLKAKAKGKVKAPKKAPDTASPRPDSAAAIAAAKAKDPKPKGRPPISTKEWLRRCRARKAAWNSSRQFGPKKLRVTKAAKAAHERPPHILHLGSNRVHRTIFTPEQSVDLADYFTPEEINPDEILFG